MIDLEIKYAHLQNITCHLILKIFKIELCFVYGIYVLLWITTRLRSILWPGKIYTIFKIKLRVIRAFIKIQTRLVIPFYFIVFIFIICWDKNWTSSINEIYSRNSSSFKFKRAFTPTVIPYFIQLSWNCFNLHNVHMLLCRVSRITEERRERPVNSRRQKRKKMNSKLKR